MSNTITVKGGFKRDIRTDHKWRRGSQETEHTVKEIERKAKRVRPVYAKSAYQYAPDEDSRDALTIFRK